MSDARDTILRFLRPILLSCLDGMSHVAVRAQSAVHRRGIACRRVGVVLWWFDRRLGQTTRAVRLLLVVDGAGGPRACDVHLRVPPSLVGALRLLNHRALEQRLQPVLNSSFLRGRWLGELPRDQGSRRNTLACLFEQRAPINIGLDPAAHLARTSVSRWFHDRIQLGLFMLEGATRVLKLPSLCSNLFGCYLKLHTVRRWRKSPNSSWRMIVKHSRAGQRAIP